MKQNNALLALFLAGCTLISACGIGHSPTRHKIGSAGGTGAGGTGAGGTGAGGTTGTGGAGAGPGIAIQNCADLEHCKINIKGEVVDLYVQHQNANTSKYQIKTDRSYTGIYVKNNHYIKLYTVGENTQNLPTANQDVTYTGEFKVWELQKETKTLTSKTPAGTGAVTVNVNFSEVGVTNAMQFTFTYPSSTETKAMGTFNANGSFTYGTNGTSKGQFYGPNAEEMAGADHSGNALTIFTAKKQ